MLKLLYCRQSSENSKYCLNVANETINSGGNVVMLVPEQYTFETQKLLLENLGDSLSNKISILSFTGLCEDISTKFGGLASINVDDGIRFILIKKALRLVSDDLKHYKRYANSSDFAKKMLTVIGELKTADVSYEKLLELSLSLNPSVFSDKLNDISLILKCYDSLLGSRFAEPFDLIKKTVDRLQDSSYFIGKTFIINEFKGFTESQYLLLDRIIGSSKDTHITLCSDEPAFKNETEVFLNVKKSAFKIKNLATSRGVEVSEKVVTDNKKYTSDALQNLELHLAEKSFDVYNSNASDISIVKTDSVESEVDFVMCTIRRLVREENYRYNDFVIISRSAEKYSDVIGISSARYGVPCYVDNKISALSLPLSIFAVSALKCAETLDTADILKMLKTGLTNLTELQILELENYSYVWNITGSGWKTEWNEDPKGLTSANKRSKVNNEQLNLTRVKVYNALAKLKRALGSTAETACRGLLSFFEDMGTVDALSKYTTYLESIGNLAEAEYQRLGFDIFINTLDKLVLSSENDDVSANDFADMLSSALSFEKVGEIPQTKDQVIYGTADRIRSAEPKIAFVIGVNENEFPKATSEGDIFSRTEREVMRNSNIGVSDHSLEDAIDEKFIFYYACTLASEKLFLTYTVVNSDGKELLPSAVIDDIVSRFPNCNLISEKKNDLSLEKIETKDSAFRLLLSSECKNSSLYNELEGYFSNDSQYQGKLQAVKSFSDKPHRTLTDESVDNLYKNDIVLSATKIETFSTCKFMHFCRYSLGVEPQRRVDFDALTKGNIIHFVLENFVNSHKNDIGFVSIDDIKAETSELCDKYIESLGVDKLSLDERFLYMLELLKKTAEYIVTSLNNEFAQSSYKPIACELKIGNGDGGVESVKVPTDKGRNVKIIGSVDRVDATDTGKVRVVDYKSGKKEFELTDLLNGVKMQMLIYLYSIIKNGKDKLSVEHPTAVLYFPARKDPANCSGDYIRMNGIITSDIESIREMEASGNGEIVPVKFRQNGTSYYENKSTIDDDVFKAVFKYVELSLMRIGSLIEKGDISAEPLVDSMHSACDWCDYKLICRAPDNDSKRERKELKKSAAIDELRAETEGY